MELKEYRFDEVTINFDKKRVPLSGAQREKRQGNFRYYGAQGVIDHIDDFIFDGTYLLIAEDGENLKSKKQNIAQVVEGQFWVNNHAHIVQGNELCNTRYLCYLLNSMDLSGYVTGSAQPKLSQANLNAVTLFLPSITVQERIVECLYLFDKKIAVNQKINDNLYEMVNAYYTSLFRENDCEMTTVGNYAERIYSGGTPMTSNAAYWNGTFGWFSSGETRNRFVISTEKTITQAGIDNSSTKLATKYDIVMASAGQGFTRGQISMLLIDTYVNQSVIVIKSERNILPYLFWNLVNRYDELRAISDSSSIRGSLTTKMIAAFEIPLANEQSLQAFADFAWSVIPQIENNLLENERLTALRDSLLPKLMSGEIDVTDIQL